MSCLLKGVWRNIFLPDGGSSPPNHPLALCTCCASQATSTNHRLCVLSGHAPYWQPPPNYWLYVFSGKVKYSQCSPRFCVFFWACAIMKMTLNSSLALCMCWKVSCCQSPLATYWCCVFGGNTTISKALNFPPTLTFLEMHCPLNCTLTLCMLWKCSNLQATHCLWICWQCSDFPDPLNYPPTLYFLVTL